MLPERPGFAGHRSLFRQSHSVSARPVMGIVPSNPGNPDRLPSLLHAKDG